LGSAYEEAAHGTVPAIRASLSVALAKKYKMSECEIAEALGITQAAVSKYLSGKYSSKIKRLQARISKSMLDEGAESIAAHKASAAACLCDICESIRTSKCYLREAH